VLRRIVEPNLGLRRIKLRGGYISIESSVRSDLFLLLYVPLFVLSVAVSALLTYWVRTTAVKRGLSATPVYGRHTHTQPLPRLGGIAICLTFMLAALAYLPISRFLHTPFSTRSCLGILAPVLLIFLMGAYDDLKPLKPKSKIATEATAAILLYGGGVGIHFFDSLLRGHIIGKAIDLPLTILWVLLITNAFNLIDGLDGLAAGSALISAIVLFAASQSGGNGLLTFLVVALLGAILGFLPFNFHPASIFMGDSGSLFIGFLLSALSMASARKATSFAGVAIPLLAFGLPILDVTLAVWRRFLRGSPLFRGDTDHIHHKLLSRGFSHRQAVLTLYAVTLVFVLASLVVLADQALLAPVLFVVGIGICLGVQQLRYSEFAQLFEPAARRRQILTNHEGIRRAVEALSLCSDFRTICQILQETLLPIGLDAIRIKNLGKDGFPMALFHSLRYDLDGKWYFEWSERETDDLPWEYDFRVLGHSQPSLGYAALFRMGPSEDVRLTWDLLAEEFRNSLSDAVEQSTARMRTLYQTEQNAELNLVRAACRAAD
jgi:UDP-GlcNAc:undecaprenyl-phosphate GlcNAc-1-phosphate transferase